MNIVEGDDGNLWFASTSPAEDSPIVRWPLMAAACGLAFGSGVAVFASHLIDRLRGR